MTDSVDSESAVRAARPANPAADPRPHTVTHSLSELVTVTHSVTLVTHTAEAHTQ